MKKRYRIGICLVLVVCLLFLSACEGKPDAAATDTSPSVNSPVQTTGSTPTQAASETTAAQPNENPAETNDKENTSAPELETNTLPAALAFRWKSAFLHSMGCPVSNTLSSAKQFNYEELKDFLNAHTLFFDPNDPEGDYHQILCDTIYPSAFYEDNSLILIPAKAPNAALEITDVQYADGVLKCTVKTWLRPEEETNSWDSSLNWNFYCFIEIDTVLPEGTQIVCEFTEERLSSAEYRIKLDNFKELCLYYGYHDTYYD